VDSVGTTDNLMLANASGGHPVFLNELTGGAYPCMSWSPDGQWVSYLRSGRGKLELVKIRATPGAKPVTLTDATPSAFRGTQWSPAGDWILYPVLADGLDLISPDGKSRRRLTSRAFVAYNFSKDGTQVYGIFQNMTGEGAQWQLYSVNVNNGAEKFLAPVDFPASTAALAGFSIHPDGKRALTSIAKWPLQIWMLEGFAQPPPRNWFARLLHR